MGYCRNAAKSRILGVSALLLGAAVMWPKLSHAQACDIATIRSARELHEILSRRAVEAVKLASGLNWATDRRLATLVAGDAPIGLGRSDVGRPQGQGILGLRKLAQTMEADSYRFMGWDWMDDKADPCGPNEVSVSFIDTRGQDVSEVKFTFKNGQIAEAMGWERSFESGAIPLVRFPP